MVDANYLDNIKETIAFRDSPRGKYIMAQALYLGVKALYLYPEPYREVSNALDMKYLLDALHPGMWDMLEQIQPPLLPEGVKTGGKPVSPTSKAPAIDLLLSEVAGKSREITLAENKCMTCEGDAIEFKDSLCFKDY